MPIECSSHSSRIPRPCASESAYRLLNPMMNSQRALLSVSIRAAHLKRASRERLSLALTHMANDHRRLERVLHLWRRVYSRRVLSPPLRPRILYRLLASILEPRGAGEEADHHMPRNEWNRAMPHGDGRDGHHQAAGMSGIPIIHALPHD